MDLLRIAWTDHQDINNIVGHYRPPSQSSCNSNLLRQGVAPVTLTLTLTPWQSSMADLFKTKAFADTRVYCSHGSWIECHQLVLARAPPVNIVPDEDDLLILYICDDIGETESLHAHLMTCLNEGTYSDVAIVINGDIVRAHRCILCAHSAYFKAMFSQPFLESHILTVCLEDTDTNTLTCVLWYMYGGSKYTDMLTDENAVPALILAHRLMIPALVSELIHQLESSVTLSNVCSFLHLSRTLDLSYLQDVCVSMCARNLAELEMSPGFGDMDDQLKQCLHTVQKSFERMPTSVNTIIRARELLALLKESLDETQERFDISYALHMQHTLENEDRLNQCVIGSDTYKSLLERKDRYSKVETILIHQGRKLERQWQFYLEQKAAFDLIGLSIKTEWA